MEKSVQDAISRLYGVDSEIELTRPAPQFGDWATSVALKLAGQLGKSPREVAEAIAGEIRSLEEASEVSIAGPGFINIRLSDASIMASLAYAAVKAPVGRLLIEYSCPNPFKEIHTGHMYQTFLGDSIARIYEKAGATVFRANFGGDVGLHVGKAMWGIIKQLEGEHTEKLDDVPENDRAAWLSRAYVAGSKAYEEDEAAKLEIIALNKKIYQLHADSDHDTPFAQIYWVCRQWSYDYFKKFYEEVAVVPFDSFYPESASSVPGLELVQGNIGPIFKESEGAVILPEEVSGLHTRVFVTSEGLPTYETKDLGVIQLEAADFAYDRRIIMTGNDQAEYMKVVFAALKLVDPALGAKQVHAVNGTIRFGSGQKMSSRLGNVARAIEVVEAAREAVEAKDDTARRQIALGAVKYSLLKNRLGGDIAFDLEQSVSLEGNSGPYLQYAAVRAAKILSKTTKDTAEASPALDEYERALAVKLGEYADSLQAVLQDNSPHHLCGYLYELSQVFSRFYENSRVIGDDREALRAQLVRRYHHVLVEGLGLLGIEVPEEM